MTERKDKAEDTKRRILQAAYQIVREDGIQALSSTKIIKAVGISQGGFFHHFPQIEDLYLYMLDQMIRQMDAELSPKNSNPFENLYETQPTIQYSFSINRRKPLLRFSIF
ncbi:MAG: TetR/AcrR family transcriptional regulator [Thermodesulfobacteriota bacterium]